MHTWSAHITGIGISQVGLLLSEMILRHCDKLSQTLQSPDLSSVEGHEIAMLTVKTLQTLLILICFGRKLKTRVCEFYDDLDRKELESQLKVFHTLCQEKMEMAEKPTIKLLKKILLLLKDL